MAKEKMFEWIGPRGYTARGIAPGFLEPGKFYPVKNVPKTVLATWVATGNAKLPKDKEK